MLSINVYGWFIENIVLLLYMLKMGPNQNHQPLDSHKEEEVAAEF